MNTRPNKRNFRALIDDIRRQGAERLTNRRATPQPTTKRTAHRYDYRRTYRYGLTRPLKTGFRLTLGYHLANILGSLINLAVVLTLLLIAAYIWNHFAG